MEGVWSAPSSRRRPPAMRRPLGAHAIREVLNLDAKSSHSRFGVGFPRVKCWRRQSAVINIKVGMALAMSALADPGRHARGYFPGVGQDRRQAEAAASCVDWAEGLVLSCVLVRRHSRCHRVTVRGSIGARGDRSAEGTYVARGIDSAHSEVVRGTPFQGSDREGRACRCTRLCEAGRRAAAAPDLIVVDVVGFDRRVPGERDLGAAWDGRQSSGLGWWCGIWCGCAARDPA